MSKESILVTRASMPDMEEYFDTIRPLWDSHWITNMGTFHQELEQKLKKFYTLINDKSLNSKTSFYYNPFNVKTVY